MSDILTIDEMFRQVPEGESRLFERSVSDTVENRFFSVRYNHYSGLVLDWHNPLPMEEAPWTGNRYKARIPISVLPPPVLTFEGKADRIVDFYAWGGLQTFFISDKLRALIDDLDPGSLDSRPVMIKAKDRSIVFNLVMPARSIDAIDPQRTDVLIKDEKLATQWARRVRFPTGVVFRENALKHVHNFSDFNVNVWLWSRELIDAAKAAGIKGVRAKRPGMVTGPDEYSF
jgi:hypothetical protein